MILDDGDGKTIEILDPRETTQEEYFGPEILARGDEVHQYFKEIREGLNPTPPAHLHPALIEKGAEAPS